MDENGGKKVQDLIKTQYRDSSNLDARVRLHQLFSINQRGWYNWYLDQLSLPAGSRILELGCGPGGLWSGNLQRLPGDWTLALTDFSHGMARKARSALETEAKGQGRTLLFAVADAQTIPFPDGWFDAVIANHMLYHVPDLSKALSEIRRVLRPGGKLYAATNGETHMQELSQLAALFAPEMAEYLSDIKPWAWTSPFSLEKGEALLKPYFSSIRMLRYEDGLRVTQAQPLIDYMLSMVVASRFSSLFTPERIERFKQQLEEAIKTNGAIMIRKDSGIFEAVP